MKLGCRAAFQATVDPGRHRSLPSRIPRPFAATGIGTKILRGCAFRRVYLSREGFSRAFNDRDRIPSEILSLFRSPCLNFFPFPFYHDFTTSPTSPYIPSEFETSAGNKLDRGQARSVHTPSPLLHPQKTHSQSIRCETSFGKNERPKHPIANPLLPSANPF